MWARGRITAGKNPVLHYREDTVVSPGKYQKLNMGIPPSKQDGDSLIVKKNGTLMSLGTDYTVDGAKIVMSVVTGDAVDVASKTVVPRRAPPVFTDLIPGAASLLHFDGSFADAVSGVTWTPTNVSIGTTDKKFGSGAMSGGAAYNHYLKSDQNFTIGTSDFTFEGWVKVTIGSGNRAALVVPSYMNFVLYANSGIAPKVNFPGGFITGAMTSGAWSHFAIVRSAGVCSLFIEGVKQATTVVDTTNVAAARIILGSNISGFYGIGLLDEFRFTLGAALYTTNFTPPTGPFTYP